MPASDIFALGILAFYALSGHFPVDPHVSQTDYDRALVAQQAPGILSLAAGISDDLAKVVDRCLSRQPARRYLDGAELMSALDGLGGN